MKIGYRKPSVKKSIKARTTGKVKRKMKKAVNPFYGKKGMGYVKNPKKAVYNNIYNKTTFGVSDIYNTTNKTPNKSNNYNNNATSAKTKRKKVNVPIGEHPTTKKERISQTVVSILLFVFAALIDLWIFAYFSNTFKIITIGIFFIIMILLVINTWKQKITIEYKRMYEDELTSEDIELIRKINPNYKTIYETDKDTTNYQYSNNKTQTNYNKDFSFVDNISDYNISVFLNAYKKGSPIMPNSKYYKYFETECNINNPSKFHKQLISNGYFVTDSNNSNNFILSDKGKEFLKEHDDCVKIHSYKKYDITWQEYSVKKNSYPDLSCDEIIWMILEKKYAAYRAKKMWGFARNIMLYKAQICDSNKNYAQAFKYYTIVLYYDLSGCNNDNYIDEKENVLYIAPAIEKKLQKYSTYYNDDVIDVCFKIKLPHHYFNEETFKNELLKILNK